MTKTRVGIYVRESRDDKGERVETIETQKSLLVHYIQEADLGELWAIYEDDNVSGVNFQRPGLSCLQEDVLQGRLDLLVLKDLSRLGRSNARTLLFLEFLQENGVRVLTFDGRFDSERDGETVGIDSWYNERYVMDISRKIRSNLRHKIERGEYLGNAPYGYQKALTAQGRLVPKPEEATVVRQIFDWYCREWGYKKIASVLNEQKISPPGEERSRSGLWSSTAVRRILGNRVYLGDTIQGVSEKISYKGKKTRSLPPSRWVVTPGTHEPLVTEAQFEEVCKIRKGRQTDGRRYKGERHLFQGFLACGDCGAPLYARWQKGRTPGYLCSRYGQEGKKACSRHFIEESFLAQVVYNDLADWVEGYMAAHPDWDLAACVLDRRQLAAGERSSAVSPISEDILRAQQEKLERKLELLYEDRLEGRISGELYARMQEKLEAQGLQLCQQRDLARERRDREKQALSCLGPQLVACLRACGNLGGSGEPFPGIARRFLGLCLGKIHVYEDRVELRYNIACFSTADRVESSHMRGADFV